MRVDGSTKLGILDTSLNDEEIAELRNIVGAEATEQFVTEFISCFTVLDWDDHYNNSATWCDTT